MHLHLDSLILLAWELWRLGWNMAVRSWFSPPIDGRNFLRSISSLMDSSLNFSIKMDQGILFFFLMSWIMDIMSESRIYSSLTPCNCVWFVFTLKLSTKTILNDIMLVADIWGNESSSEWQYYLMKKHVFLSSAFNDRSIIMVYLIYRLLKEKHQNWEALKLLRRFQVVPCHYKHKW